MDLVYILGRGSRWANNEIRYSLRSLKNLEGDCGHVWIVGVRPPWVGNIKHMPVDDPYRRKIPNAMHKILVACRNPEVSDDFLLMNDDFYFLEPQKVKNLARKSLKDLVNQYEKFPRNTYAAALKIAYLYLKKEGIKEPLDFDIHYPIVFNKDKFISVFKDFNIGKQIITFRSVYGNLFIKNPEIIEKDFKVHSVTDLHRLRDSNFISSSDSVVFNSRFKEFLKSKFPNRSKYENALF